MNTFKRLVILINPVSSSAGQSKARIERLKAAFPRAKMTVIETSPKGNEATAARLRTHADKLGAETLLAIAAGDGTVSQTLESLLTDDAFSAEARRTVVIPLWGGNANDLAHMLSGDVAHVNIKDLARQGNVVAIYPLEFQLKTPTKTTTKLAMCYASFGASAHAANQLNQPSHRRQLLRKVRALSGLADAGAVIQSYARAPVFKIRYAQKPDRSRNVYEYIFMNGPRMATIDAKMLELSDQAYYRLVIRRKHPRMLLRLLQVVRGQRHGKISSDPHSFTVEQAITAQFDGEVMPIEANTKITIRPSDTPFYALSNKLS